MHARLNRGSLGRGGDLLPDSDSNALKVIESSFARVGHRQSSNARQGNYFRTNTMMRTVNLAI